MLHPDHLRPQRTVAHAAPDRSGQPRPRPRMEGYHVPINLASTDHLLVAAPTPHRGAGCGAAAAHHREHPWQWAVSAGHQQRDQRHQRVREPSSTSPCPGRPTPIPSTWTATYHAAEPSRTLTGTVGNTNDPGHLPISIHTAAPARELGASDTPSSRAMPACTDPPG
jgi:hypothetical protein